MQKKILLSSLLAILSTSPGLGFAQWSAEIGSGIPYNFPTPLHVKQNGFPDLDITAKYNTHPFHSPQYYKMRISKWQDDRAFELEFIHHKIYLTNETAEIQSFWISHGYNLIYINRAWLMRSYIWRLGAGIMVAHPESTIRGQFYNMEDRHDKDGYHLAGVSIQGSVAKRGYFTKKAFVELEGKLTASYAKVPIANGHAIAPNIALHANFSIGYEFW